MAGSVNAGLVSTDNSGINLVITREAVPQGTLTPELYRETLALYGANLMGTPNMPAGKSLWQRPRRLLDYSGTVGR